jgi:hypothetical protein
VASKRKRDTDTGYSRAFASIPDLAPPTPAIEAGTVRAGGPLRVKVQGDATLETRGLLNALTRVMNRTAGEILAEGLELVRDGLDRKEAAQVDQVHAALLAAARASVTAAAAAPKRPRRPKKT